MEKMMPKSFRILPGLLCVLCALLLTPVLNGDEPQTAPAQTQPQSAKARVTEQDLPADTLAGLTDPQKVTALNVANTKLCTCGCKDTIAGCKVHDKVCTTSPRLLAQVVDLARSGKSEAEIGAALDATNLKAPAPTPQQGPMSVSYVPIRSDDAIDGPKAALVTIVEFSDFQCPYCGRAFPTLKQIRQTYGDSVRIIWKNQPLSFHPNALPAAEAADAARQQGKFWEMHDLMFANQNQLSPEKYEEWAKQIGLDIDKFKAAALNPATMSRIQEDASLGNSVGANATPTFFINGKIVIGAVPFDQFKTIIDSELAKAKAVADKGTAVDDSFYKQMVDLNLKDAKPLRQPQAQVQAPQTPKVVNVPFRPTDPLEGPRFAKVTIVEFSDFQCPYCGRVYPTLKQVLANYGKDVRIIWKNQPLAFHPNAMPAAEAAEAAREQGKFWQMHDLMFSNQSQLSPAKYEEWAQQIGLDMEKFKKSVAEHANKARIEADMALGQSIGAGATPTFFINGRLVIGALPYESFKAVIDHEVFHANVMLKEGAKLDDKFYSLIVQSNQKAAAAEQAEKPAGTK